MTLSDTVNEVFGHFLLFLLVFGMSATVDLRCVLQQLSNYRALCMGVVLQFVMLPFLGFLTVKMLNLNNAMGITLLMVTSSPGGSYSNWWCSAFNADLALSVTMTAISTILSVIMLPLNLYFYIPKAFSNSEDVDVFGILDFGSLMTSILVVFGAIGSGIYASDKVKHPKFHVYANRVGTFAGVTLVILAGIHANAGKIWEKDARYYWGVALPCIIALILSTAVASYAGLKKPERVTLAIESCYQNCGIATSIALSMFQGDSRADAMGVPFFYGLVEILIVGVYCITAWKGGWTKAPPTDPFWDVVTTSYEVLLADKMAGENQTIDVQLAQQDVEGGEPSKPTHDGEDADENYVLVDDKPLYWKSLGYEIN